jgi:hypothetical protein
MTRKRPYHGVVVVWSSQIFISAERLHTLVAKGHPGRHFYPHHLPPENAVLPQGGTTSNHVGLENKFDREPRDVKMRSWSIMEAWQLRNSGDCK